MIGGTVETSASFEARYAPLSYPTFWKLGFEVYLAYRVLRYDGISEFRARVFRRLGPPVMTSLGMRRLAIYDH